MSRAEIRLTARELEVLDYLAQGKTTKEIAQIIFLSDETVKSHRAKLMQKFDAKNAFHLGVLVAQYGFLNTQLKLVKVAS